MTDARVDAPEPEKPVPFQRVKGPDGKKVVALAYLYETPGLGGPRPIPFTMPVVDRPGRLILELLDRHDALAREVARLKAQLEKKKG